METKQLPLSPEQEAQYEAVCSKLDLNRLKRLLHAVTDIHSPTGRAGQTARFMTDTLSGIGMNAQYFDMTEVSGNTFATLPGNGGGASLMLYAPIDTHLEGNEDDYPWAAPAPTVDLLPQAKTVGDWVYGLGSSNPKAMVAGLTEICRAVIEAEIPLKGDLMLAFGDGGMPVTVPERHYAGMSNGVMHLVNHGGYPDCCVIMKPNNCVFHEEPGMGWFKVTVWGTLGYTGVPRGVPGFRSSIVPAATVIQEIEAWFAEYCERNSTPDILAEGWLAAAQSGWSERRPAFPSAATELYFDVRIHPQVSPAEVKAQFAEFIDRMTAKHPDIEVSWEMYGSVPGGTTDPNHWIIQSGKRGWEHVERRPYPGPTALGGQTDGAALRRLGIPTARMGWEWPAQGSPEPIAEGLGGMGATYVPDLEPCLRKIAYVLVDTLTRERSEILGPASKPS